MAPHDTPALCTTCWFLRHLTFPYCRHKNKQKQQLQKNIQGGFFRLHLWNLDSFLGRLMQFLLFSRLVVTRSSARSHLLLIPCQSFLQPCSPPPHTHSNSPPSPQDHLLLLCSITCLSSSLFPLLSGAHGSDSAFGEVAASSSLCLASCTSRLFSFMSGCMCLCCFFFFLPVNLCATPSLDPLLPTATTTRPACPSSPPVIFSHSSACLCPVTQPRKS